MSSSWSEIRSRANNDPLLDTISDLQARANQSEAINNITTTDKIPPIRIIRSKVEIHDKDMMTGYTRPRNTDTVYYMGTEPDGDHLRLQAKFDSACDTLNDYSMQGNTINIGYNDTLPVLLKATEDDGVTAGDMVSVVDGATQYYRIPVTDAISIKKMVLDGKPGITIIYRHFPLFIKNELNSTGMQRATPVYMIENDQVEYAVKWEVDDAGFIYFFFRHQFINYYVRTVNPIVNPPPVPDYYAPDFSPLDFDAAQQYYDIQFPTPYVDLAMEFNFATKLISVYVNSVLVPTTTTAVTLVPPLPAPIFPPAFADPPPPPEQPEPFFQPFVKVYEQLNDTSALKVNAITTTQQNAFYNVPGTPPVTEPLETLVDVVTPPNNLYPGGSGDTTPTIDWSNINNYVLLGEVLSATDNGISLGTTTNQAVSFKWDSATVGIGPALVGQVIHRISFSIKKVDDPNGTLFCNIRDTSGNSLYSYVVAGMAVNAATFITPDPITGYVNGHFGNHTNTHVMALGERITFDYTPNNTGQVFVQTSATKVEPALSTSRRAVGAGINTWTADTTHDLRVRLWRKKTDIELGGGTDPGGGTGGGGGGGTTPPTTKLIGEIISTNNSGAFLSSSDNNAVAIQINDVSSGLGQKLNGKVLFSAKFGLAPANNPTGRIFCKIWDANDVEVGKIGADPNGVDVSTLLAADTDNDGWMHHIFAGGGNTVVIREGYKIGVEWKTNDSNAQIRVRRVSTDVDDSVCQASRDVDDTDFRINESYDTECSFWEAVTTTQPAPLPSPLDPIPQPAGDGGAADTNGVKATYSSATGTAIKYNFIENFQGDSYRFDFEGLGSTFPSAELIGYFRFTSSPPDDEVAGKMGGGEHSSGSTPKCYVLGCGITDGKTRYRVEENHPTTNGGSSGGTGKTLGSNYVGYKYVKWNKGSSVLLEIWQDQGNNEGSTPANQWVRLASWNVTSPLWLTPPSDHQETIRIDGVNDNLEWKWISLRPIGTNDTGTSTGGGTGGAGGGTGVNTTYDTWPSSTILSNNLLSEYIAAQTFGAGVDTIGSIPTTIGLPIWRNDAATSGTYHLRHYDSLGNVKKTLFSAPVVTLPLVIPDNRNIFWQDVLNDTPILDNDMIGVEVEGVINSARVYVMNNKVFRGDVSGGTTVPISPTTGSTLPNAPPILATPPSHFMKLYHPTGCTLSGAVVHLIFWGNDWKTRKSPWSKDDVTAALDQVFQSRFWDGLIQYGIKRPRRGVSVISTAYPDYDNYSGQDITRAIFDSITAGVVPKQTADNLQVYMLIPNVTQDIGNDPGLQNAGGYHTAGYFVNPTPIQSTLRPGEQVYIPYGWTRAWKDSYDQLLVTITHEICEIITDPYPIYTRLGVFQDAISQATFESATTSSEICDVCPNGVIFNGHLMASWWSNQNNGCIGNNNAPTWLSCSTGRTWNPAIQECVGNKATTTTTTTTVTVGGTYSNDFDDARSCLVTKRIGSNLFTSINRAVDICMLLKRGGGDFIGYIELNNRRKRLGTKANQDGSLLIGKVLSKIDLIMKRVGVTALGGLVRCNLRNSLGTLMQEFGTFDATSIALTDTPVTFINTQQTYAMVQGDVVSIEYDTGGSSTTSPTATITAPTIPAQPATQGMIYRGGPVYSEPNVYIILDGTAWNTMTTPFSKAQFITACDTVFASTYFDALLQYGIKKPKFHTYVVNTTLPLPSSYTFTNVKATVENSKTIGQVPSHLPTSQHNIYIVIAGPGKTLITPSFITDAGTIVAYNASYWTDSTNATTIANTATVYAVNSLRPTDTLARVTRSTFHEMVELMASPVNDSTTPTAAPNAWKVNPAVLSTANGVQICDPGEGLNPILGTTGGGTTGGGGGTGATSGSVDQWGVKASYATGTIKYDWFQNFQGSSYRFDFEDNIYPNFVSCELIGYFKSTSTWNDEVSGKMGGGAHFDGSRPQVYDMGIDIQTGATRYRTEDFHPRYTGGQSGPSGSGLKSTYTGYKFVKWNQGTSSVKLEIWQDRGNNEGSTPANEWVRVATWNVTDPLWLIPKSDHQETIRIDGASNALSWKWLSLREIKPTDTAAATTQPADIGVTVAAYYSNLDFGVVPPPALPTWITCSTGTYNSTIQSCISSTIGGGSNPASGSYLMVRASQGFFNAADASKTMLFEGVLPDINFPSVIYNRDLAGVMYTGGRTDLDARPIRGVKVATPASVLYDKVITEVRLRLKGTGILAVGNLLRVKIIRGTDKVTVAIIGSLDINSISTTQFIEYYFQNPDNKYRMKVGDLVALEFNHGNSDFIFLEVKTSTPQITDIHSPQPIIPTYDDTNTIMFEYSGKSWIDDAGRDITGSMSIGGYTVDPDPVVIPPQPPFHYAHEWFISAAAPADSNALTDPAELLPVPNSHYNNISKEFRIYDFLLTPLQLENYYENRFSITPISKGQIEVVGHDVTPISTS